MFWDLLGGIFEFLFGLLFPSKFRSDSILTSMAMYLPIIYLFLPPGSGSGDEPDSEEVETT